MTSAPHTAAALAERFGLGLRGDGGRAIDGVATLARAERHQLAFLANPRYRSQLAASGAGAVVLREEDADGWDGTALIAKDPYAAFAKIAALFDHRPAVAPGIHPSAAIDPTAEISNEACIGPFVSVGARTRVAAGAVVGPGCTIGEDCAIGEGSELVARVSLVRRVRLGRRVLIHPGAVLGADGFGLAMEHGRWLKVPQLGGVVVGDDCEIGANTCIDRSALDDTVLEEDVRLGRHVRIHPGAVLGADGFGLAMQDGHWLKVPQLGGVVVGDDCEIGANTCIDRGAIEDTVLGEDVRLDNLVQIGHNFIVGAHTAMAGCAAVAGSAKIGRYCLIGGGAGIVGHIEICDKVLVTAMTLVTHSLHEPGEYSSGTPIQPSRDWRRNAARFKHLDALARKIGGLPQAKD